MEVKLTDRYNCIAAYVGSSTFSGLTTVGAGAGAAVDDDASAIVYRYMIDSRWLMNAYSTFASFHSL